MDIKDIIKGRRSIRKFKNKMPSEGDLETILEAARWAPSGLNNQPWRFVVVREPERKIGLAKFTKYGSIIESAPAVIVVCLSTADSYNREKDLMAIGACVQNMLLQAYATGFGSCWLGEILNKKKEVADFLKLDKGLEVAAVVALGYPDEKDIVAGRKHLKELLIK
jgi:nitroreductase